MDAAYAADRRRELVWQGWTFTGSKVIGGGRVTVRCYEKQVADGWTWVLVAFAAAVCMLAAGLLCGCCCLAVWLFPQWGW